MIPIRYNLRSLAVRRVTSIATAVGIALVVCVLAVAMMAAAGVRKTMTTGAHDDVAIVLRKGSDNELGSSVENSAVPVILATPGVRRGVDAGAGEVVAIATMEKLGAEGVTNVTLRGVGAGSRAIRPEVKIIDGRLPEPGRDEAIIGRRARGRFKGLELGSTFELRRNRPVTVVGVFEADGSATESEVWIDLDVLRAAFAREGYVSSVRVKLESPAAFTAFKTAIESEKRLGFMALRETEFFEKQSEGTSTFIGILGQSIAIFCALGAMIGAAITMYAAVANRQREIGTLRALGFSRRAILFSFLLESSALALVGGVVGVLGALAFGSVRISMMNFQSFSEIVFKFDPNPQVLGTALGFALFMGIAGGFLPAVRASRVSAIQAMRG
jgi:putative ABC transport system permease protein